MKKGVAKKGWMFHKKWVAGMIERIKKLTTNTRCDAVFTIIYTSCMLKIAEVHFLEQHYEIILNLLTEFTKDWDFLKTNTDLQAEFHTVFKVIWHHLMVTNQIAFTTDNRPKPQTGHRATVNRKI